MVALLLTLCGCRAHPINREERREQMELIQLRVNDQVFELELEDSPASDALLDLLPLDLIMEDVNANEKFVRLEKELPRADQVAGRIEVGQVKLWAGDGLVIFYKDFPSSYAYTDLGRVKDIDGLVDSLGIGSVNVTLETINNN